MKRRVVITGLGLCTPVGRSVEEFWGNLAGGRSGVGAISHFNAASFPVRIGGEVKTLDLSQMEKQFPAASGESDRKVWLGLDAARSAVNDAGLSAVLCRKTPLFVGVSLEAFPLERFALLVDPGPPVRIDLTKPVAPLQTPLDRLAQVIGDQYHLGAGRYTNCSACAAGRLIWPWRERRTAP